MRRIVWLQVYLAIMLAAAALFVEAGDTRLRLPSAEYYGTVRAYRVTDHTGEVVFMGSSVVGCGVIPKAVSDGLRQRGLDQEVYDLYFAAGLAPTYKTALRDLVLTNGKPALVVLCISPRDLNDNSKRLEQYVLDFASFTDVLAIIGRDPWSKHNLLWPLLSRSTAGLTQMAGAWRMGGRKADGSLARQGARWDYQDGSAETAERNLRLAGELSEERYQKRLDISRELLEGYATEEFEGFLDDTIAMAKAADIAVALCLFDYSDDAREALADGHVTATERILAGLARKHDVPLWRSTALWPAAHERTSYLDGVDHLAPRAAMAMSRAFGEGPVADLLLGLPQ